jgi:hypothetical protein
VVEFLARAGDLIRDVLLTSCGVFGIVFVIMVAVLIRSFGWNTVLTVGGKKELVSKYFRKIQIKIFRILSII